MSEEKANIVLTELSRVVEELLSVPCIAAAVTY
jgi:hypothetical protein